MRNRKRRPGNPLINPVFLEEERMMVAEVDKAMVLANGHLIGANGEKPLLTFFNRYLPSTMKAVTGKFVTPRGNTSPQIDIMIVDSRYPLLSHHSDGSVVVMLHSLIQTLEVKTSVAKREIFDTIRSARLIRELATQVFPRVAWGAVSLSAIGYRAGVASDTLLDHYVDAAGGYDDLNITILRARDRENLGPATAMGIVLHHEPCPRIPVDGDVERDGCPSEWSPDLLETVAPLSDFYYDVVQCGYYALDSRSFGFGEIGAHMLDYDTWWDSQLTKDRALRNNKGGG
jgi:hypothetical protein